MKSLLDEFVNSKQILICVEKKSWNSPSGIIILLQPIGLFYVFYKSKMKSLNTYATQGQTILLLHRFFPIELAFRISQYAFLFRKLINKMNKLLKERVFPIKQFILRDDSIMGEITKELFITTPFHHIRILVVSRVFHRKHRIRGLTDGKTKNIHLRLGFRIL